MTQDKIDKYREATILLLRLADTASKENGERWGDTATRIIEDMEDYLREQEEKNARVGREYPGRNQ